MADFKQIQKEEAIESARGRENLKISSPARSLTLLEAVGTAATLLLTVSMLAIYLLMDAFFFWVCFLMPNDEAGQEMRLAEGLLMVVCMTVCFGFTWVLSIITQSQYAFLKQYLTSRKGDVVELKSLDCHGVTGQSIEEGQEFLEMVTEMERKYPNLYVMFSESKGGKVIRELQRIDDDDDSSDDGSDSSDDENETSLLDREYITEYEKAHINKLLDQIVHRIDALLTEIDRGSAEIRAGQVGLDSSCVVLNDDEHSPGAVDSLEFSYYADDESDGGVKLDRDSETETMSNTSSKSGRVFVDECDETGMPH